MPVEGSYSKATRAQPSCLLLSAVQSKCARSQLRVERSCVSSAVKLADTKWSAVAYAFGHRDAGSPTFVVGDLLRWSECEKT